MPLIVKVFHRIKFNLKLTYIYLVKIYYTKMKLNSAIMRYFLLEKTNFINMIKLLAVKKHDAG